ncbi:putative PEP-binding protein [Jiangella alba]|uniref:Phosphoenolpyruvate-protein phosphotransferase n=1 Tax=Jiangella alba TaxID=561176 RepID=A0A1H5Q013_9ACTN|nr:putative PEP-binding protein [Jiangella alba]SEF18587.1 phosphoenolpyruvate--protein phosphotransferase [Jiangella alba]
MPDHPPTTLIGRGAGRGAAVGPIVQLTSAITRPDGEPAGPPEAARAALTAVADDLTERAAAADGTLAEVLTVTAQMAADPALAADIEQRVKQGDGPATAIWDAFDPFLETLAGLGGYIAERVTDLRSVRDRAVSRALGRPEPGPARLAEPSVVVAADLSPADTSALDLGNVAAIVTEEGGPTSHTAIIAGQLGIPCVVRVAGATGLPAGRLAAVDSATGAVTLDPDDELVARVRRAAAARAELRGTAPATHTADGHPAAVLANVGTVADAAAAAAAGATGVGLLRTEVLYLDRSTAPGVDEQAAAYREVLGHFPGGKVVVRTLDSGADKPLAFAEQPGEENPALGVRGYRLARRRPDLLDDQLAALARAQHDGGAELWVMAPMVSTAAEAAEFAALARGHGLTRVGAMIEVPSAALRAEAILAELDFVSIGTNDLAQYTMAADRLRGELADLLDPWQPAVLDLVAATARAGAAAGTPVGVCGESAADPLMALVLVGLGVTSLSMAPAAAAEVSHMVAGHTLEDCRRAAAAALAAPGAARARAAAEASIRPN